MSNEKSIPPAESFTLEFTPTIRVLVSFAHSVNPDPCMGIYPSFRAEELGIDMVEQMDAAVLVQVIVEWAELKAEKMRAKP